MFLGPLIALGIIAVLAGLALCAAHIPGIREITGAAPLQSDDEETSR